MGVVSLLGVDSGFRVESECRGREDTYGGRNCALRTISPPRSHMAATSLTERSNGAKDMT